MHAAHHPHARPVRQALGSLRISSDALSRENRAAQFPVSQSLIAEHQGAPRVAYLQEAVDYVLRFGVIVIVFAQVELPVGAEEEEALYSLNFLNGKVVQLAAQLPVQKSAGPRPGKHQQGGK